MQRRTKEHRIGQERYALHEEEVPDVAIMMPAAGMGKVEQQGSRIQSRMLVGRVKTAAAKCEHHLCEHAWPR